LEGKKAMDHFVTVQLDTDSPPPLARPDVPNGVPLCDRDGCEQPAVFAYTWEWGEHGKCCEHHRFLLQQAAGNIERRITISALQPDAPAPLERPERIQLTARALTAEAETTDAKARGLELYRQNTLLTTQLQALTVRHREAEAQLQDARARMADLSAELERRTAEAGNIHDELSRLRALVPSAADLELDAAEDERIQLELESLRAELEQERRKNQG
jgi:chromosome segregation ATPase